MQITFEFICRDCGADARILWDTAREGAGPVELKCSLCGHVSGELLPAAYTFREGHRPSWENAVGKEGAN